MGKAYEVSAWNDAQKYISEIIHPLLADHMRYSQRSIYGAASLEESRKMSPQQRELERFNGLKGMIGTTLIICDEIFSTVSLKKKKEQVDMLKTISQKLNDLLEYMDLHPDVFFIDSEEQVTLNKQKFQHFRNYDVNCYKNVTKIMTFNNMLFKGDFEEMSQDEIIEELEREFMDA